jgi:hypothetical protein
VNDDPGLEVLAEFDTGIAMFERWGHTHSYEFFVARRPGWPLLAWRRFHDPFSGPHVTASRRS